MSKKNNGDRPTVNAADRIAVLDALANLLVRFRPKEKHYYNLIGNNDDVLMHALGCSPITYGAIMYTANVLGLKKKKNQSYDVFYVRTDRHSGWDEIASRHHLFDGLCPSCRMSAGHGYVLPPRIMIKKPLKNSGCWRVLNNT